MHRLITALTLIIFSTLPLQADKAAFVDLAKRGWNYQLRTTMPGRDLSLPVTINGRSMAGASLCMVGERPDALSRRVIDAFRDLVRHTYGKPLPTRYAGRLATGCGSGRTVVLRLYSGEPPNLDLSADLAWMNRVYQLGLPHQRYYAATSPAMAQTFFGRLGQSTHIMVKQSAFPNSGPLEAAFYKSILIEELFQSFTFGMDILLFDRQAAFQSKLQETPMNLRRLRWDSRAFMRALVNSNPSGLCMFDVFMMHAVGEAPVKQTTEPAFIDYIEREYGRLLVRATETLADERFAAILTPSCARSAL